MHKYTFTAAARTSTRLAAILALTGLSAWSQPARASEGASAACINSLYADGHMVVHFDAPQLADHIALTTLHAPAGTVMRVSDGAHSALMTADQTAEDHSDITLRSPLRGTDFTISIDNASTSDDAVCITAVHFAQGELALAPHTDAAIGALDADAATLVGNWTSSVTNMTAGTLRIAADGSWQLRTSQSVREGSWQYSDGQLQMRLGTAGAFASMHLVTQVVAARQDDGMGASESGHTVLMLSGALIAELGGTYTNAQAR